MNEQEGLAVASIVRDVGRSCTNRSSDIMHLLPRITKENSSTQTIIKMATSLIKTKLSRVSGPDSQ